MSITSGILRLSTLLSYFISIRSTSLIARCLMPNAARVCLFSGICVLMTSVVNAYTAEIITPSFQRAEVIAGISGVSLMLVAFLWTEVTPAPKVKADLTGHQGFELQTDLSVDLKNELAWGSHQILKATSASTILVYWDNKVLLKRGLIINKEFKPGDICKRASVKGKLVSLVNTSMFPGRKEFDTILDSLPSVIIYPMSSKGWVIVGGWTVRCFTNSDEIWISGWSERLKEKLEII